MIPARLGCISPVLPVANHPGNKNSVIVYDLRYDPSDLLQLDAEQIAGRLFVSQDELSEGEERIALKEVHLNKSPVLSPMNTLSDSAAQEWQIDRTAMQQHLEAILSAKGLDEKIRKLFSAQRFAVERDPDAMLYDGFIQAHDRKTCDQVLHAEPEQLAAFADQFNDVRLPELLFRYRARNWPETLNQQEKLQWQSFCQARLHDEGHHIGISLKSFGQKLAALTIDPTLSEPQRAIVDALLDWPVELGY
jgi:exodeoxyribonuclease-1